MCSDCRTSPCLIGCPNYIIPPIVRAIRNELEKAELIEDEIKNEFEDVEALFSELRYISFDLKERILSEYKDKLLGEQENIYDYKARLEEIEI